VLFKTTPKVALALLLIAVAAALAGCGDDEKPLGVTTVDVRLDNGTFASPPAGTTTVPANSIVIVKITAGNDQRYRLSILSPTVAQTAKLKPGEKIDFTLDALSAGESAKLVLHGKTLTLAPPKM
jgi:hypothetical protein